MAGEISSGQVADVLRERFSETAERQLREWGLWRRCFREVAGELAAASMVESHPDEPALLALASRRLGIDKTNAAQELPRRFPGLSPEQIRARLLRDERLRLFRSHKWAEQLPRMFLKYRATLDRIVYSLLRVRDGDLAVELFMRIHEGECSFESIAREYSEGPESHTGGLLGPVPASSPHADLASVLAASEPGQLSPPRRMGEWHIVLRLEKRLPAQLDEATSDWLLERSFDEWVDELAQIEENKAKAS